MIGHCHSNIVFVSSSIDVMKAPEGSEPRDAALLYHGGDGVPFHYHPSKQESYVHGPDGLVAVCHTSGRK